MGDFGLRAEPTGEGFEIFQVFRVGNTAGLIRLHGIFHHIRPVQVGDGKLGIGAEFYPLIEIFDPFVVEFKRWHQGYQGHAGRAHNDQDRAPLDQDKVGKAAEEFLHRIFVFCPRLGVDWQ